ncbi:putative receptor-like protein kinase [Morus notabilis]|uniref:Putative receptor-like protein kinase n=1 Tax=Morus notabilis TaxID=981085 RepID=W9RBS7_9ROSA|nr:putative receptor-like protein kinase [Morus notabilis]
MAVSSLHCLLLLAVMMVNTIVADDQPGTACSEARCGENGPPIRFPFRLKDDRLQQNNDCSYPGFDLFCAGNQTAINLPIMPITALFVSKIDYKSQQLQVYSNSNCLPRLLLSGFDNRSLINSPFQLRNRGKNSKNYTQLKCTSGSGTCSTLFIPSNSEIDDYQDGVMFCTKMIEFESVPYQIYKLLWRGYDGSNIPLSWSTPDCRHCEAKGKGCRLKKGSAETECSASRKVATSGSILLLLVVSSSFYLYYLRKKNRENSRRIEKFLEDYNALKPSRYTYADIKKITDKFKDILGQGSYGTVFKGKLSNDIVVAVKILNDSTGNGEEFINEVSTMVQIYHINVVRLVGYCADGFRRALIYEFLPNDSLEKYISSSVSAGGKNPSLSWKTLQDIALGIAKGIEYLHQGCDKRILHFDIKPHNILLDQNFVPKISDFGLAKLCSKDQSAVSMATARGTLGYIAPEVFSRNFGNVSYKSDVYSFGMLLLEMVGGRRNINATDQGNMDGIYYPEWIYNLLEGDDFRILIEEEGNANIAKKLAIVGLWCIQWHPVGRPTMKVIIQMLEGERELTMPPNPFTSVGQSSTNAEQPTRAAMALELEVIPE